MYVYLPNYHISYPYTIEDYLDHHPYPSTKKENNKEKQEKRRPPRNTGPRLRQTLTPPMRRNVSIMRGIDTTPVRPHPTPEGRDDLVIYH
jgi:hypothetical protein